MPEDCPGSVRRLFAWEIQEARLVFANRLQYDHIRIHECARWPNRINRIGVWLKRMPYVPVQNAITLGNHCYFPIRLFPADAMPAKFDLDRMAWLIHELTHAWQYQQLGWRYLYLALRAQLREGAHAYDFGDESGLRERSSKGLTLSSFNLEQQGDIARSFYLRIRRNQDTGAWQRYIAEFQEPGGGFRMA